jgi:hypothetical protein
MATTGDEDWRSIAEQASVEMDSDTLLVLVKRLCSAIDAERKGRYPSQSATLPPLDPPGHS